MRNGKLFCIGWLPILLSSLALLLLTVTMELRDIEQRVQQSATDSLSAPQFSWAKVETYNRGRQVLITGAAPDKQAIADAIAKVKSAEGVFSVLHNGQALAPPREPSRLLIELRGKRIELSGVLGDQAQVDQIVSQATSIFGVNNVSQSVRLGGNLAPLDNTKVITALTPGQGSTERLIVAIVGDNITVSGEVSDNQVADGLIQRLSEYSNNLSNKVIISPPVESNECEELVGTLLKQGKINFESGQAEIAESSFDLLNEITGIARRCPDALFEVAGHTDNVGNPDFNALLSQRRAEAVVAYVVEAGLDAEQFSAKGYGSRRPIADNNTSEGRASNRRIEFKLRN